MLRRIIKNSGLSSMLLAIFMMIGCAGGGLELVAQDISNAETLINQAIEEDAETYAPLELKLAEESLEEAKKALEEDEPEIASRKADLAKEHARVADAKAKSEKAKKQAENEEKDLDMLRDEIDRARKIK